MYWLPKKEKKTTKQGEQKKFRVGGEQHGKEKAMATPHQVSKYCSAAAYFVLFAHGVLRLQTPAVTTAIHCAVYAYEMLVTYKYGPSMVEWSKKDVYVHHGMFVVGVLLMFIETKVRGWPTIWSPKVQNTAYVQAAINFNEGMQTVESLVQRRLLRTSHRLTMRLAANALLLYTELIGIHEFLAGRLQWVAGLACLMVLTPFGPVPRLVWVYKLSSKLMRRCAHNAIGPSLDTAHSHHR